MKKLKISYFPLLALFSVEIGVLMYLFISGLFTFGFDWQTFQFIVTFLSLYGCCLWLSIEHYKKKIYSTKQKYILYIINGVLLVTIAICLHNLYFNTTIETFLKYKNDPELLPTVTGMLIMQCLYIVTLIGYYAFFLFLTIKGLKRKAVTNEVGDLA